MPLLETKGAGSAQGFGLSLGGEEAVYIEDVFSTYLYTGTGASLPIVNGIDLDAEGGLVWTKSRSDSSFHKWYDSARGISFAIESNTTDANQTEVTGITSFNYNGYTYGTDGNTNSSGTNYVSWTFRKQPKFFDVVTYTGDGVAGRTIAHNLGSTPGCIIVKRLNDAENWDVYHRSVGATGELRLNQTAGTLTDIQFWNNTEPTSTVFTVGTNSGINASGGTYVAYLFAHNAGGFGLTGLDNVISCGLTTANGSGDFSVNLGYEPQWVLIKSTGSGRWSLFDNMRGVTASSGYTSSKRLQPHLSDAEDQLSSPYGLGVNETGFTGNLATFSNDFIYIAIRRGPMKVPTSGTQVFTPIARTGTGANATIASGFTTDLQIVKSRSQPYSNAWFDRLRGTGIALFSESTVADQDYGNVLNFQNNTGVNISSETLINQSGQTFANLSFKRAPGFFDEVCYTGTGVATTQAHNLAAVPELMIVKRRNASGNEWTVYTSDGGISKLMFLNLTDGYLTDSNLWVATPTSTLFSLPGTTPTYDVYLNTSGGTYVAYLFATLAGVSKVGNYTGTGTTQVINCGFTAGARFVMIKRTDSTGSWYYWDSARGIVAGDDPYLLFNSSNAEVTNTDYIDTASTGFEISSTAPAAINASGGNFIFFAVA